MKIAKGVAAVIVAVTSLVLVSACSGKDKGGSSAAPSGAAGQAGSGSAAPPKGQGAAEQLAAAASKTGGGTYTYTMTSSALKVDGTVDPAGPTSTGKAVVTVEKTTVTFETLFSSGLYLVKITGLPLPGLDGSKWLKIDKSKLTSDDVLGAADVKDPTGLADLSTVVGEVTTVDGREFKGTLDLTKGRLTLIDDAATKGLGDLARAVPFTATVDEKGYLTSVKVNVPAYSGTKADNVTVTYAAFGAPLSPPNPSASEVIDAPTAAYRLLNGQ